LGVVKVVILASGWVVVVNTQNYTPTTGRNKYSVQSSSSGAGTSRFFSSIEIAA
jgi:hypothetical protein